MRRSFAFLAVVAVLWPAGARAVPFEPMPPIDGPIVRHFEPPPTPYSAGHRGIDFAAPIGSAVVATESGVVAFAGSVGGDLFVSIDHPNGLRSTYSYLSAVLVKKGISVAQGQIVARSGRGHIESPEPVLHFGIRSGDTYLDPERMLLDSMRRNIWRVIGLAA